MISVKTLREANGISQQTLADHLGVSRMSVSRYENGTRTPRTNVLIRIADYFGVKVDELLRNQDGTCQ